MMTNWFYAQNGTQAGPISEPELLRLVNSDQLNKDSLVWHEGLPDWQPLGVALPSAFGLSPETPQIGGIAVAEQDKDALVQQMREGVPLEDLGSVVYAGFWVRVGAKMLDGLILTIPQMLVRVGVTALLGAPETPVVKPGEFNPQTFIPLVTIMLISAVIAGSYEIFCIHKFGATVGKKAFHLKVVAQDGGPISLGRSVGRYFSTWISGMTLGIGYIMAGMDSKKRALHDRIADTLVIKTR